ncbi:hypothetical protein MKY41_01625 [Sporosarcina sp. FSL W7-1349]|uniref:hypothetical protein n=1 Tax=Sporosarcina sp. FSL W7-1349 TaxID=2921561 RepID=UPI0030FA98E1
MVNHININEIEFIISNYTEVVEKFEEESELVLELTHLCDGNENIFKSSKGAEINLMLLSTVYKFINLVEHFKKISGAICAKFFDGNYKDMNNVLLDDDLTDELIRILENRNYFAHLSSTDQIVNSNFESRIMNTLTKEMDHIIKRYGIAFSL